ncbi:lysylphosphatidylglycerol synthase transmembrane domain-containing protein [Nitrospira sp. M1]
MNYAFWFRIVVSLVVTLVLIQAIDWEAFPGMDDISFGYLFGAGLLVILNRLLNAYRWYLLINQLSSSVKLREVVGIYFKSAFVGLVMPSSVGGEFLKGYGLMKSGSGAIDSFSSIFMERVLGLISLLGSALIGFLFLNIQLDEMHELTIGRVFGVFLIVMIGGLIACYFLVPWVEERLNPQSKFASLILKLRHAFLFYQKIKARLFLAFLLSFCIQGFRIFGAWLVGLGLGLSVELAYYVLFIPIISLISMIPISIAGLGVQEGAYVYFFSLTGTNATIILTMALVLRFLLIFAVLPGGILYLREGLWKNSKLNETVKPQI